MWLINAIKRNSYLDTETARAFCYAAHVQWKPRGIKRSSKPRKPTITHAELEKCRKQRYGVRDVQ